jgi:hypothetical protein
MSAAVRPTTAVTSFAPRRLHATIGGGRAARVTPV